MTFQEKADAFLSLSKLLDAGIPILKALGILADQKPAPKVAAWLLGLKNELTEYHSFSQAIAGTDGVSDLEKNLIYAGERSGKLPQMLAEIADYYRLLAESQKRALKGLFYPAVLLQLAVVFSEIPRLFGEESSIPVLSHIFVKSLLLWLLLLGLFKAFITLTRYANHSPRLEKILDGIPFYGEVRKRGARARFAKVAEIGVLAALGMPEVFRLAGFAAQSSRIRVAADLIASLTAQGESLTDSFAKTEPFPRWFREAVAVAEASGTLDTGLKRLAQMEHQAFIEAHERASKRLPLIFYGIAACYATFQILRQYYAHFSLYREYM